ncbi:nitroimidazol reductase NimA-like FMN-containing flavoprotein (pyridoxamine 5'-phosphate oxidase superfamily) [Nocardioides sp. J9]|uniref:pyridoxamine 5'-phosphate oxidase family protein n=1 Tax=unclassified Nocardioides TaxID=2615069 RepID=UPI0004BC0F92|nr:MULTISPECIES: pyridoxamine 5'-phosphate oxidase family protein [unclassified Nocardioides]TWG97815.1 nitroimidazol reductase NimA-like FMN-containing flavoprotein (pyridoxamine 5'-phosphate oxidase superfamily) [Nocardioides sp. J9]
MSGAPRLHDLTPDECERLLRAAVLGRVGLVAEGRVEVLPVNYTTHGDAAWVRTSPGSLLDRYADGTELVLEVDHVDHERGHGWSVVARGHGERVTEDERTDEERRRPGPPRWVRREDEVWVQLRWEELTGRRTGTAWDLTAGLPVRRVWG